MTETNIFKKYPKMTHYYQVGTRTFLSAFEDKAKQYARSTGEKLKIIKRPKTTDNNGSK